MRKAPAAIVWLFLYGVFTWAFDSFLWDWFTQYLQTAWHIKEADVIVTVSSFIGPALVVGASYWVLWKLSKSSVETASAVQFNADMPIAEAIDYIVNDSIAKLRQPAPPRIAEYGPAKGRLLVEKGVEHSDALTKLNERIIVGDLKVWGLRQMPVTHIANQFEHFRRPIEPAYWDRMHLDFLSCFHKTTAMPQTAPIPGKQADLLWTDLTLNGEQLRKIWPRKPIWRRAMEKVTHRKRISYFDLALPPSNQYNVTAEHEAESASPLEIVFDPANTGRKFWSIEPIRDENGTPTSTSQWEYRAIIKNSSTKTLRNVKVTVEAVGPMPTRPETTLFDINKKPMIDLTPGEEALAIIRRWFNPPIVQGMAIGADIYGPIKLIASADDVLPATKFFHFDPMRTPMIFE
jgi:hypothetical protein